MAEDPTLKRFEKQFEKELSEKAVTEQTRFEYAWGLANSKNRNDVITSIKYFQELLDDFPSSARIYLFFLARGYHVVHQNQKAMETIEKLLAIEPNNSQALALRKEIDDEVTKDGAIGMALVAGAVAVVGVAVAIFARK